MVLQVICVPGLWSLFVVAMTRTQVLLPPSDAILFKIRVGYISDAVLSFPADF